MKPPSADPRDGIFIRPVDLNRFSQTDLNFERLVGPLIDFHSKLLSVTAAYYSIRYALCKEEQRDQCLEALLTMFRAEFASSPFRCLLGDFFEEVQLAKGRDTILFVGLMAKERNGVLGSLRSGDTVTGQSLYKIDRNLRSKGHHCAFIDICARDLGHRPPVVIWPPGGPPPLPPGQPPITVFLPPIATHSVEVFTAPGASHVDSRLQRLRKRLPNVVRRAWFMATPAEPAGRFSLPAPMGSEDTQVKGKSKEKRSSVTASKAKGKASCCMDRATTETGLLLAHLAKMLACTINLAAKKTQVVTLGSTAGLHFTGGLGRHLPLFSLSGDREFVIPFWDHGKSAADRNNKAITLRHPAGIGLVHDDLENMLTWLLEEIRMSAQT